MKHDDFIYKFNIAREPCDDIIKYFKENTEYKKKGVYSGGEDLKVKDSTDVSFYNDTTNPTMVKYFKALAVGLDAYCKKYQIPNIRTSAAGNNIQYYKPKGGFFSWHCERGNRYFANRALVYMTYLNTVKDKGETEFKYYGKKVKAKKGLTLLWPPDFTHTHRGIPSPTEEKYIVTGWCEFEQ